MLALSRFSHGLPDVCENALSLPIILKIWMTFSNAGWREMLPGTRTCFWKLRQNDVFLSVSFNVYEVQIWDLIIAQLAAFASSWLLSRKLLYLPLQIIQYKLGYLPRSKSVTYTRSMREAVMNVLFIAGNKLPPKIYGNVIDDIMEM